MLFMVFRLLLTGSNTQKRYTRLENQRSDSNMLNAIQLKWLDVQSLIYSAMRIDVSLLLDNPYRVLFKQC